MGVVTGSAPFNGGTVTRPLTISDPITGTLLSVQGAHTDLTVDGFAELIINGDAGGQIQLNATGTNNTASVSLSGTDGGAGAWDTQSGLTLTPSGTVVFQFTTSAFLFGGLNAAPNSAFLSAGQCALWFDQTNGASKLMVKAKSANGTVVTGSVALA